MPAKRSTAGRIKRHKRREEFVNIDVIETVELGLNTTFAAWTYNGHIPGPAGGQGERLHPLTVSRPKPAVPFGGSLDRGFDRVVAVFLCDHGNRSRAAELFEKNGYKAATFCALEDWKAKGDKVGDKPRSRHSSLFDRRPREAHLFFVQRRPA